MKGKSLSRVRLFTTPLTAAHQAPLSMGLSKQDYWSGLPFLLRYYAYTNNKYIVLLTSSLYSSVLNYANVWVTQK